MKTFIDLFEFLQNYKEDNIIDWLEIPWKGKDKQESLLRLFSGLGLVEKLKEYYICKGNFNLNTIEKMNGIHDIFYKDRKEINLKDKGDSSDLTGILKTNDRHLLLTTSKNLNKMNIGKLDIDKILTNFKQYYGYKMTLCICTRFRKELKQIVSRSESTNHELKNLIETNTIIIDWYDLNQAYNSFKNIFSHVKLKDILGIHKETLCLKMHQEVSVIKTLELKKSKNIVLWGHIQRSGKSYIISGCIIHDSINKNKCNYLIITTAPNETIEQQINVLNCLQLNDFNIIELNGKNNDPVITNKNIVLCSKQFLQTKINNNKKSVYIPWLKKMKFDMRFVDESHNGGTTYLAQKVLDYYGKNSFTVQITATYSKPIYDYKISRESWILWDLEDIKLCKNINNKDNFNKLCEKHGQIMINIIKKYTPENIMAEYMKYPELWILTDNIKQNVIEDIIDSTQDNNYGWSTESCFLLKQNNEIILDEFQNEQENLKLWYKIFGKVNKFGIPDKEYKDDQVFIKRIERICKNPEINSRFFSTNSPTVIMAFLPQNNINKLSKAIIKLLEKNNVIPDYEIISINSKISTNPKDIIKNSYISAKNNNKKGILVLSGKQCSLGVSIDNCDIVLLLNNNMSYDMIYQMMFRCMTEGKNKKCGFVVDLNIHRVIETSLINYATLIKPDLHPKKSIKYILQERLVNLNNDHWMPSFGNNINNIDILCDNIYNLYSSNTENALNYFLNKISLKNITLTDEENKALKIMFLKNSIIKIKVQEKKENVKVGIEKAKIEILNKLVDDEKEEQVNYMAILRHVIPLICLLTIFNKETNIIEMFKVIENNRYLYSILINQTQTWWGENINSKIIKKFINVYIKYMKDDNETNQIIRTVKELFIKNINNQKQMSKLIDKYLIPQEVERKNNAEISTPYPLRQEMLSKIPDSFWTKKRKVFEPCSGKGGFLIDIIDRFMIGLKERYPNEKQRYKIIVEECLYFSDINPTNIFICKLLVDPNNTYNLNYNEGNTLDLDINKKWKVKGFDAIIGNPPYQTQFATGDNKLYLDFIRYSIDNLLDSKYLLFIVPTNIKNYITNQDKNRSYIDTFMDIKYLSINTSNKYFTNVSTYFSYFLIKKTKVEKCKTKTSFLRGKTIEHSSIVISEKDNLPLCLSSNDFNIINKTSNLIKNNWDTLDIKKALYKKDNQKKVCTQRIRKQHIKNGDIKEKCDTKYKYKIIDKVNKSNPFPGVYYYNNYKMKDYGKSKVIMCTGGYLMPSFDKEGIYNISDNMLYLLVKNEKEYNGLVILINSLLIKYLNKVTMTDNIHGRDVVIKNIRYVDLEKISCENDVYKIFNITDSELEIMKKTI